MRRNHPEQGLRPRPRARTIALSPALSPALFLASLLLAASIGCSKDHSLDSVRNPRDPGQGGMVPTTATNLSARVANRSVTLNWALKDSSQAGEVRQYYVYRRDPQAEPVLADSVSLPPATLSGLDNGSVYRFSVSVVLVNGLEGERSPEIIASPASYGLQIEGGLAKVTSSNVRIGLLTPEGATGVRLSNTPDVESAPLQPISTSVNWQLLPGEGDRTVYAQFEDQQGNASGVVSDMVTVDSHAVIQTLTFEPAVAAPGEVIQFRMETGEAFGEATVRLGANGRELRLLDQGGGLYTLDYVVEEDLLLVEGVVTGTFTDEAGNQASPRTGGTLTIAGTLAPVTLHASGSTEESVLLSFSQSLSPAFAEYRIYRDYDGDQDNETGWRLLDTITRASSTTYEDTTDLEEGHVYTYMVRVVDDFGHTADSNTTTGSIPNQVPTAVTLNSPNSYDETTILLTWSQNRDLDFDRYALYRGTSAGVDTSAQTRVAVIRPKETTSHSDRGLIENTTYYYRLYVIDKGGLAAPSTNELRQDTRNARPAAVQFTSLDTLRAGGDPAIRLTWEISLAHDFQDYRLYRDTAPSTGEDDGDLIRTIGDSTAVVFLDQHLEENTTYYYRVFVRDEEGASTGSEERSVTTVNLPPDVPTLSADVDTLNRSVTLTWSESDARDFDRYELRYGTSPSLINQLIGSYRDPERTQATFYIDEGVDTRYYFRLTVFDDQGASAMSDVVTARIAEARAGRPGGHP